MNALVSLTAATLILAWNPIAPANVAAPIEPPVVKNDRASAPVVIRTEVLKGEEKSVKAKIIIPKKFVHAEGGRAIIVPAPGSAPALRGAAPPANDRQSSLPMGSVIAGLALSLAAVSAVFVFRGNRNTKTVALAVLAGAVVLGALSAAQADLIVPGRERPREPNLIVIELTDDGDSVTLLLAK